MDNDKKKASVIGFVKYSQRNVSFGSKSKKRKDIFESGYFNYRFDIFRNVTLKSFQEQTDMDFCLLLVHSESMPQEYKDRFLLLEKENLFLHNVFVEDNKQSHSGAVKNTINLVAFDENDTAITFRIDNDDAVSKDYIASLKKYLKRDFIGTVISMPNILIVKRHSENRYHIEKKYYPANSLGLAFVSERNSYSTVLSLGEHTKANSSHPMLLACGYVGLQTINGNNVINAIDDRKSTIFNKEELRQYLEGMNFSYFDLQCLNVINTNFRDSVDRIMKLFLPPIILKFINLVKKVVSR